MKTPKAEADLVITLMNDDLKTNTRWTDNQRLDYLKDIGNHVDEIGEEILRASQLGESPHRFTPVGENRPEHEDSDIDMIKALQEAMPNATIVDMGAKHSGLDLELLTALFEAFRPPGHTGINPANFISGCDCLKGDDAVAWLYARKYTHEYSHIHVFKGDRCLLLSDEDDPDEGIVQWIEPDGVRLEGDIEKVLKAMFFDYSESMNG